MKLKLYLLPALILFSCVQLAAQDQPEGATTKAPAGKSTLPMNMIKVNLTSLPLKQYALQYERVLNRKFSFALGVRVMPASTLPFKQAILDAVGDDPDTRDVLDRFQMSNLAITPEFRFYLSKRGYGRGFYLAPFYRYASYKTSKLEFDYDDGAGGTETINMTGKLTSNTGGLLLGAQWPLGKRLVLDWWILGPHYGSGNGLFSGASTQTMTPAEQDDLRTQLEDIDIPLTNTKVVVTANGASLELDGPWAGIRAGFSLGIRF
jgi:Protein of unknown function (DUF3575)